MTTFGISAAGFNRQDIHSCYLTHIIRSLKKTQYSTIFTTSFDSNTIDCFEQGFIQ